MLLPAYRLAEQRTVSTPELERIVLALAVPGFALLLGLIPLHAWTLSVASGAPREMLLGVVGVVQTAGFMLLLRTFEQHPWLTAQAGAPLILGGALSALLGGWLAVSARRADPDDWLVYALVAHSGMMMVGLGTQSRAAAVGVTLMLFARALAVVLLAVSPRTRGLPRRAAVTAATLALAGTPGLAGFPGLWLVLRRLLETGDELPPLPGKPLVPLALLAGSGLLFATALRRWRIPQAGMDAARIGGVAEAAKAAGLERAAGDRTLALAPTAGDATRARQMVWLLVILLLAAGLAPQLLAEPFGRALERMFFLLD
jgi:formate hydrogenlyase subunit 3/multisubunit Na+/H+ antiporter MnhD subunit